MLVTRNDYPGTTLMEPEYYQYLLLMLLAIAKNRPENLLHSLPKLSSSKFLSEKKARVERERERRKERREGGRRERRRGREVRSLLRGGERG